MKHVRISDPYVIQQVERIREARGDKTSSKTAGNLIIERITAMDERGRASEVERARSENRNAPAQSAA